MSEPRRIQITHFHKGDACYPGEKWIGQTGIFNPDPSQYWPGYYKGYFYSDSGEPCVEAYFLGIRYRRI